MATYKKYKAGKDAEKQNEAEHIFDKIEKRTEESEHFFEKHRKIFYGIIYGAIALLLVYWAYYKWVHEPSEKEAATEMAFAQQAMAMDSLSLALNGNTTNFGFKQIADQFSGTKAGNMSAYLTGSIYYREGDYTNALIYLKKFSSDDAVLEAEAHGLIGDCYAQQDNAKEAMAAYKKAAQVSDNEFTAPFYLLKAGHLAVVLADYPEALTLFEKVKNKYPESVQAEGIDKYIEFAKAAAGK